MVIKLAIKSFKSIKLAFRSLGSFRSYTELHVLRHSEQNSKLFKTSCYNRVKKWDKNYFIDKFANVNRQKRNRKLLELRLIKLNRKE